MCVGKVHTRWPGHSTPDMPRLLCSRCCHVMFTKITVFFLCVCRNYKPKPSRIKTCRTRGFAKNKWCQACVNKQRAIFCEFRRVAVTSVVVPTTQEKNKHDTQTLATTTRQSKIKTCVARKLDKELQCKSCRNKRGIIQRST